MDVKNETEQDVDYKVVNGGGGNDREEYFTEEGDLLGGSPLGPRSITGQFPPPAGRPWMVIFTLRHASGGPFQSAWFDNPEQIVKLVETTPGDYIVIPASLTGDASLALPVEARAGHHAA